MLDRDDVFEIVGGERDYQEQQKSREGSHVVEDFPLGSGLSAIQKNLDDAIKEWYYDTAPYPRAMDFVRKIAAICVQMGEKYGMPERKPDVSQIGYATYECQVQIPNRFWKEGVGYEVLWRGRPTSVQKNTLLFKSQGETALQAEKACNKDIQKFAEDNGIQLYELKS